MTQVTVDNETYTRTISTNNAVAVNDDTERLLDFEEGTTTWNTNGPQAIYVLDDGGMVVYNSSTNSNTLFRVKPDGTEDWSEYYSGGDVVFDVDESAGRVYVGFDVTNGDLEVLDLSDGSSITKNESAVSHTITTVALSNDNNNLYVAQTGTPLVDEFDTSLSATGNSWTIGASEIKVGKANSNNNVPYTTTDGHLGYIDADNSTEVSILSGNGNTYEVPTLTDNGILACTNGSSNSVVAYETSTKAKKWEINTSPNSPQNTSSSLNQSVYFAWNGLCRKIAEDGTIEEVFQTSSSPAALHATSTNGKDSLGVMHNDEAVVFSLSNAQRKVYQVTVDISSSNSFEVSGTIVLSSPSSEGASTDMILTSGDTIEPQNSARISGYRVK